MKKNLFLLCVCLFSFFTLHAEIIEIKKIEDLLVHVDQDTLCIFDLDNTLIELQQVLGSDQWFSATIKKYISSGDSVEEALNKVLDVYVPIHEKSAVSLVEENALMVLEYLNNKNIPFFALTARGEVMNDSTHAQLASVNISFLNERFGVDKKTLQKEG